MSEPNPDGKYQCTACDYGHEIGKSRQAVIKHYKKTHVEKEEPNDAPIIDDTFETEEKPDIEFIPIEEKEEVPQDNEEPIWLSMGSDEDGPSEPKRLKAPIRDFLRSLRMQSQGVGSEPASRAELVAQRKVHHRLLTWIWGGADRLYTIWGKMMTQDRKYVYEKSQAENGILATATLDSLEYHNIDVNMMLNPDVVLAVTIGTFYGPETVKVVRKRKKGNTKFLSKIPFIGRFFREKKREVKRSVIDTESDNGAGQ